MIWSDDLLGALLSVPKVLPDILPLFVPYTLVLAAFGSFIVWNGGIVLGRRKAWQGHHLSLIGMQVTRLTMCLHSIYPRCITSWLLQPRLDGPHWSVGMEGSSDWLAVLVVACLVLRSKLY